MPIICWGNLAKSADDTTRIEQSIEDYIAGHDENPNAHMGEDYALGAHRLQTILDHPYGSIKYFHVYDIHAEAITAGGMVVKGGGPYISVQDQEGVERVKVYPEGIIVKKGKVVIEDEKDLAVLDAKGLVGANIFYSGEANLDSEFTLKGFGKWYPVPPLEFGVYLPRATPVLLFGNIVYWVKSEENVLHITIQYNQFFSPALNGWSLMVPIGETRIDGMFSFNRILQLYAGANLVRPVFKADVVSDFAAGISAGDHVSSFGYVMLGS